jgi:nitrogen regulatory protein PII
MVSSPNDANIPDLGSVLTVIGKLSADDANDFFGLGAPHPTVFERLGFPMNDGVDASFGQQKIKPINEEKHELKSEVERTTTDDVIQIGTNQVKIGKLFDGPIVVVDQVEKVMEDAAPDCKEEKTDKVIDSKYLQPRWCPLSLTRTQKRKLQRLRLTEMQEKG